MHPGSIAVSIYPILILIWWKTLFSWKINCFNISYIDINQSSFIGIEIPLGSFNISYIDINPTHFPPSFLPLYPKTPTKSRFFSFFTKQDKIFYYPRILPHFPI